MANYLFGREDEEDVTFDDLEQNLGPKEDEDLDFHEYETTDMSDGKNHATGKEIVEAEMECDPAAATEAFISEMFGLSREDLEEAADEVVEASETAEEEEAADEYGDGAADVTVDDDDGDTVIGVDVTGDGEDDITVEVDGDLGEEETATDIAATEHLRRQLFYGSEDTDGEENDVNLSVEVPGESDYDIGIDGKAVTLEPGEDGGADEGDDDMADDEVEEEETTDEGDDDDDDMDDETSGESLTDWMFM